MTTLIASFVPSREAVEVVSNDEEGVEVLALRRGYPICRSTVETANRQIDKSEVSGGEYQRIPSVTQLDGLCDSDARPSLRSPEPGRTCPVSVYEASASENFTLMLKRAGYPLLNVVCRCDDRTLLLQGSVTRFYLVQIAIEAARIIAKGRKIEVQIEVAPSMTSNSRPHDNLLTPVSMARSCVARPPLR